MIELHGEIVMWAAPAVRAHLQHLAEPGAVLLVDLCPVPFCDCSGPEVLLDARHRSVPGRGRMEVGCGDGRIASLMRATRTRGLSHPVATPAEALAG
ncbi:anti-sigma factor antagonist [Streptomyces chrestomyceticus JCM 4735]|uniref:Anti-sigma factor antagonist n=1 Tax=Streptomyces chrestomyceticus JCM 4735 TaxID=1306181 RepID=A0A7U9KQG7_9ACTN|nr:STAS domain-containing protein [Streptomyces chrestomyceticus]GCD32893.1 anti-sigma factor antagonist [Streptomyces chrestomyceticus JCM 4735]